MEQRFPLKRQMLCTSCCTHTAQLSLRTGQIKIHHPGYEVDSLLLTLLGRDSEDGSIDFDTAFISCVILANNRFDGWLSHEKDPGATRITNTRLLRPGKYYFHVPDLANSDSVYQYPIVSDFRSWTFPAPDLLPPAWASVGQSTEDILPTKCVLTGHGYSLNKAHIVPSAEGTWFLKNGMEEFGRNAGGASGIGGGFLTNMLEDPGNMTLLRTDLHKAWDDKRFTFVPKKFGEEDDYTIVVHCFDSDDEVSRLYHNAPLHPTMFYKPREYLLARLAWTLLSGRLVKGFFTKNLPRNVIFCGDDGVIVEKVLQPKECVDLVLRKYRSESPRKRKQGNDDAATDFEAACQGYPESPDSGINSMDQLIATALERSRRESTRKRRRYSESFYSDADITDEEDDHLLLETGRGRRRHREDQDRTIR